MQSRRQLSNEVQSPGLASRHLFGKKLENLLPRPLGQPTHDARTQQLGHRRLVESIVQLELVELARPEYVSRVHGKELRSHTAEVNVALGLELLSQNPCRSRPPA